MAGRSSLPSNEQEQRERSLYCSDPNCTCCQALRQEYEGMKKERPPTVFRLRTGVNRRRQLKIVVHAISVDPTA
jgi:hypothetical protein